MTFEGYYQYPGRAARIVGKLTVSLDNRTLTLSTEEHNITYSLDSIEVSEPLGSIPLTILFSDGGRFVPSNDAEFRRWYHSIAKPSFIFSLEKHKYGVLVALGITVISVFLYIKVVLPFASNVIAHHIPASVEKMIGKNTYELLVDKIYAPTELPFSRQLELNALLESVTPEVMRDEKTPVRLKFIHFNGQPNAFMLPNGYLVLSDELVELANNDNEIASVMLHEMGHHYYRHGMQSLVSASALTLSIMLITGDVSGIGDTILETASGLLQLQYSRSMEEEADEFAINEMKQQNRNLDDMYTIYEALSSESVIDAPAWLSTHPDMESRMEKIKQATINQ